MGGIYVVRDPRNVITSVKNHFSFDDKHALKFITNVNTGIRKTNSDDLEPGLCLVVGQIIIIHGLNLIILENY